MNNIKGEHLICQGSKKKTTSMRVSFVGSLTPIETRILFRLIVLAKRFELNTTSHKEISEKVGCARETALRVVKKLHNSGIIYIIKRGKREDKERHKDKTHIYVLPKEVWGDMELVNLIKERPEVDSEYFGKTLPGVEYCHNMTDEELVRTVDILGLVKNSVKGKTYQQEYFKEKCKLYKKWGLEYLTFFFNGKVHEEYLGPNETTKKIQEAKKSIKNGKVSKVAGKRGFKRDVTQENIRGKEYIYSFPCNYVSEVQQRNKYIQENYIAEKWKVRYSLSEEAVIQVSAFSHSVIAHVENVLANYRNRIKDPYNFIFKLLLKEANHQGATPAWKAYYNTMEKKGYSTKFDPYNKEKRRMIDAKGLAKRVEKSYDRRIKRTLQEVDELQKKNKFKEAMQKQKEAANLRREQKNEITELYRKAREENKECKTNHYNTKTFCLSN